MHITNTQTYAGKLKQTTQYTRHNSFDGLRAAKTHAWEWIMDIALEIRIFVYHVYRKIAKEVWKKETTKNEIGF